MSRQAFIDAPVETVWDLVGDIGNHAEWWPRVVEVECEGLEEGCTYREVVKTPFGLDEMNLEIERLADCQELAIRCLKTGTFVRMALTEAQGGTFIDGTMGQDPLSMRMRVLDKVMGQRYFRDWLSKTLTALQKVAPERAGRSVG